jgi:polysaccharide deacetylase family sporulation protein PdaB
MVKWFIVGIISVTIFSACGQPRKQHSQKRNPIETKSEDNRKADLPTTDASNQAFLKENRIETASNESLKPSKKNKVKINRRYYESLGVVWDVPVRQKVIALTFDDGPNPKFTPDILQSLKQYNAKATFFVSGRSAEYYPNLVKQEVFEGHEVANHAYSHPKIWKLSNEQIKKEIDKTQQVVISVTGKKTTLFRPIGGYISDRIVHVAKEKGYTVILWSWHQDSQDWKRPGVAQMVNKVVKNARAGDIVLFHDHGQDRTQTVQAIKQILPKLQQNGYRFVTVSELLQMKTK